MSSDPTQKPKPSTGRQTRRKGLVIVNTGDGKGKTTAALGILFRAWGRGMKTCVIQFIKSDNSMYGEHRAAKKLNIELISSGDGFTWLSQDLDESAAKARHGWELAKQKIASGQYEVVVLDEMTYPFNYGWLDFDEVRRWLDAHKPPMLHLVITGRDASPALIEYADLVTEMREIKHPYRDQGIKAQKGIEF
jgi:cob(I)alamin adenosyltransferase